MPMFHFFRTSPETALRRDLARVTRRHGALTVDFDGLRAIVSCPKTGEVLVSEDVSDLLPLREQSDRLQAAIEDRVGRWLATYARRSMDPVRLVPMVRPALAPMDPDAPWSQVLGADLHVYAALEICGALAPVSEADLLEHGLRRSGIPARLRANWASRKDDLSLSMQTGELAEISIPAAPELTASLLIGGSLWPVVEGLGWQAAVAILPDRARVLLANPTHVEAEERLRDRLEQPGGPALSASLWNVTQRGDARPRPAEQLTRS